MVLDNAMYGGRSMHEKTMRLDHHIDSNEINQILDVATSYLDSGKIDEASHVLNELFELGVESPEARELEQTIETLRSESARAVNDIRPLIHFTQPLPLIEQQNAYIRKLVAETENDYNAGRLQAAYDNAMLVASLAPTYLQNFVRLAELRLALGDPQGASDLVETIRSLQTLHDNPDLNLLRAISIALNPGDTTALVDYAKFLISQKGATPLDPFVPAAIRRTSVLSPGISRELFQDYVTLNPGDEESAENYLRATLAGGSRSEFIQAFKASIQPTTAQSDLLFLRSAAALLAGDNDWPYWIETSATTVRRDPAQHEKVTLALDDADRILPHETRALLELVLALTTENWERVLLTYDSVVELHKDEPMDDCISFVLAYSRSEAAQHLGKIEGIQSFEAAARSILGSDVEKFATKSKLFGHPVNLGIVLEQYIALCRELDKKHRAIDFISTLRDLAPAKIEVRMILAEQLILANEHKAAIRELYFVAKQHESAGDHEAMVNAIRKISIAASMNVELKSMLLDIYFQRGYLDDALNELEALGELYLDRNQIGKALDSYSRAADIAFSTGNYTLGNKLFDRAAKVDPENVEIRHRAVAYFLQTGEIERATLQLRDIVRIAVDNDDPDEAVASLHQIIALDPENADAYHKLGEVLTSLGEYSQAERVYRRLSTLQPNDPVLTAKQSALAVLATSR